MAKYNIPSFKETYFGDGGIYSSKIQSGFASEIGEKIDIVLKIQSIVFALSNFYRTLPKGEFSTILYQGIVPSDPLPDAINVALALESPYLVIIGYHLGFPAGFQDRSHEGRMRSYLDLDRVQRVLNDRSVGDSSKPRLIIEPHAEHTLWQADWVAKQVEDNNISSAVVMAAPGHLPRVFMTHLMSLHKIGIKIPIIPVSHAINPCLPIVPNMSQNPDEDRDNAFTQAQFSLSEPHKILTYTKDVESLDMLEDYCEWLSVHELLRQM